MTAETTKTKTENGVTAEGQVKVPVQTLGKLTVKDIGGAPAAVTAMEGENPRFFLGRFFGIARGIKTVKGKDRQTQEEIVHKALVGTFRAINSKGERFASGLLYLPGGIHELVLEPLEKAEADRELVDVPFGYDIYSKKSTAPSGYGYVGVQLGSEPSAEDPLSKIEAAIVATPGVAKVEELTVALPPKADQKALK